MLARRMGKLRGWLVRIARIVVKRLEMELKRE
jgi:hypothetical protein